MKINRRHFITGVCMVGALSSAATEASPLVPESLQAKALGYVTDSSQVDVKKNPTFKKGQSCANCIQFNPKSKVQGTCNLFPNQEVQSQGWCKVWVLKPGTKA